MTSLVNTVQKWFVPETGGTVGSPVIGSDGTVYLATFSNTGSDVSTGVSSIDAISAAGKPGWTFTTTGDQFQASPVIAADGSIYVNGSSGTVYAISSSGTLNWSCPVDQPVYGSPVVLADGDIFVLGTSGGLFTISGGPTGGQILTQSSESDSFRAAPAVGPDGTLYFAGEDIYAVFAGGGGWTDGDFGGNFFESAPALDSKNGNLYLGDTIFGNVLGIDAATGATLWTFTTGQTIVSSPAIGSDGTVYVATTSGTVFAFSPNGTPLWTFAPPHEEFDGSPVVDSAGTIYVAGDSGFLYAVNPNGSANGPRLLAGLVSHWLSVRTAPSTCLVTGCMYLAWSRTSQVWL